MDKTPVYNRCGPNKNSTSKLSPFFSYPGTVKIAIINNMRLILTHGC